MTIIGFQEGWISKNWNPVIHQSFHFMTPKDFSVIKCSRSKVATIIISISALPPTEQWANIKCSSRFVLVNIDCLVTPFYDWCYALVYGTENMKIAVAWAVLHVLWHAIVVLHELCCMDCVACAVVHELCCMSCAAWIVLHVLWCMSCAEWAVLHVLWCIGMVHELCCMSFGAWAVVLRGHNQVVCTKPGWGRLNS